MSKLKIWLASLFLAVATAAALSQTPLKLYEPGPRLIDGSQLNLMVNTVNGLTGQGGTPSTGYFSANTTGSTGPTALTGTVLQVVGANAATGRIELDTFGGVPIFTARRANGTKASPTVVLSGDQLGSFNFHGASSTTAYYGPAASVRGYATENFSGTAGGTKIVVSTTPNTTQTLTDVAMFDQDGSLTVTGSYKSPAAATVSSNGGTFTVAAAAGGATSGNGGAVSVTAGAAATSGTGGNITITGGAGAGGTNGGGNVNLVGGAAVSTGAPGEVQINGNSAITCATYYFTGTPAATDQVFYIATRAMRVKTVSEVHAVAAGGASVLQLVKDTGTAAPGSGTDLLTNNTNTGFDLNGTANTVQTGTLVATVATVTLAAGDRLSVDFANAIQSSSGVVVTACMSPV